MKQSQRTYFIQLCVLAVIVTLAACHRTKVAIVAPAPAPAAAPRLMLGLNDVDHSAVDPRNGQLYVTDGNTFGLYSVDPTAVVKPKKGTIYFTEKYKKPVSVFELADGKPKPIINFGGVAVRVVFTHTTYLRDVAFDPSGNLYFSEATGAGADGKIYKLDLTNQAPTLFYTVRLSSMGGYWAGDFVFSPDGRLYISTGNIMGGKVFRIDDPATASPPVMVFSIPGELVLGIAFDRSGQFYYCDWEHIYQLNLNTGTRKSLFSAPGGRISGLSFP